MKYYKVATTGPGYHTQSPIELSIVDFYTELGNAFTRLNFDSFEEQRHTGWFQFYLNDDCEEGIGYFYERSRPYGSQINKKTRKSN